MVIILSWNFFRIKVFKNVFFVLYSVSSRQLSLRSGMVSFSCFQNQLNMSKVKFLICSLFEFLFGIKSNIYFDSRYTYLVVNFCQTLKTSNWGQSYETFFKRLIPTGVKIRILKKMLFSS